MWVKTTQFNSIQAEIAQLVNNGVEINRIVFVRSETIGPTADRDFFRELLRLSLNSSFIDRHSSFLMIAHIRRLRIRARTEVT